MGTTHQQIVQRALSRTLVERFTHGVPDYTAMSDDDLLAAVNKVYGRGELPMWEMVQELADRLQAHTAAA
jgi:hypothetical protein